LFGHRAYAYIALDHVHHVRREDEILKYARQALDNKDVSHGEIRGDKGSITR
jgi:hypothetical protein